MSPKSLRSPTSGPLAEDVVGPARSSEGPALLRDHLARFAARCAGMRGWRRAGFAFLAGALATLALPPGNIVPLLLISFPILIWLVDGAANGRAAFFTGWWFGFGHHLVGLYWISNALLVDAARFAWLIPLIACGLPAFLAVYAGAASWATRRLGGRGPRRVYAFAAAWAAAEWLRGHLFTGFPWNLLGYVWTDVEAMLQFTAVVGIYGLSLLTVLAAAAPAALVSPAAPDSDRQASAGSLWPAFIAFGLLLAVFVGGAARLTGIDPGTVDGVRLRIVQANVPQAMKWDAAQRVAIFRRHVELSARPAEGPPPTHIIWPETAVPFFLAEDAAALRAVAAIVPAGGALLTGAPRAEREPNGELRLGNSLLVVGAEGDVLATYDKFHLVPLGEYVPFRDWLSLAKITPGTIDFTPGPGPRTLRLPDLPAFSPLICYEAIFPGAVIESRDRPGWLLNITNDAWYGRSAGPYQHLQIARVRAVEEGLPLIRAANTGISAVIDPYGRIVSRLPLGQTGIVDADLPRALDAPTPYAQLGDIIFFVLLAIFWTRVVVYRASKFRRN